VVRQHAMCQSPKAALPRRSGRRRRELRTVQQAAVQLAIAVFAGGLSTATDCERAPHPAARSLQCCIVPLCRPAAARTSQKRGTACAGTWHGSCDCDASNA
jgi:hypothetical protein